MPQLGIAIIVDDAVHNVARALQLRIARELGTKNPALKQVPHVTLKQPFHARALEPVEAYYDQVVATLDPLPVRIEGVGWFDEEGVVFLDVWPDPRLEVLRRRILADLGERFRVKPRDVEDDRYRFHLTLAYGLAPEAYVVARAALADVEVLLRFTFDTLGLFYYTGEEWIVYKRARLQSLSPPEL
jgi:2'-5' RNA ligase